MRHPSGHNNATERGYRSLNTLRVAAHYYRQFDADFDLDVPGEGYGGWAVEDVEIRPAHTALVVMHAWDVGTPQDFPGYHRAVEYFPRANAIVRHVFPDLLSAVRASQMKLFHVVGDGDYFRRHPGYRLAVELAGPPPDPLESVQSDEVLEALRQFRADHVFPGAHNQADVARAVKALDFPAEAMPLPDEGIAENAHQLFALCKTYSVNHLVYAGFALNICMMLSPGGMLDMSRRGLLCSVFRQAVTAAENKETARDEMSKRIELWRVSVGFGFVFDVQDFVEALRRPTQNAVP